MKVVSLPILVVIFEMCVVGVVIVEGWVFAMLLQ